MGKLSRQSKENGIRTRNTRVLHPFFDPRLLSVNGHAAIPFEPILDDKLATFAITGRHGSGEPRWMVV